MPPVVMEPFVNLEVNAVFFCIGFALLCLDIYLQIYDQAQVCPDVRGSRRIHVIVIRWVAACYGLLKHIVTHRSPGTIAIILQVYMRPKKTRKLPRYINILK